ncbi:hypothetical protein H2203_008677 [Taxawa tesnikishii (nom. ined.)]|nr:hypothetical protein H2203_008677 [Dothideales sp. JES 119]
MASETVAVSSDNLSIPLIDFSAFHSNDTDLRHRTAQAVLDGFQRAGFIYLPQRGLLQATKGAKDALAWTTPRANRGYVSQGREKTTDAVDADEIEKLRLEQGQDLKESSITLLFQDNRGGLQVLSPKNTYVDATPIEDTIVVNAGDLLARWSNDTIKSTKHRVVEPR